MNSERLDSYGQNIRKLSEATARQDQLQILQNAKFKASLVSDPLDAGSKPSIDKEETGKTDDQA